MLDVSSNLYKSISNAGQLSALSVSTITETSQNRWMLRSESLAEGEVRQTHLLSGMVGMVVTVVTVEAIKVNSSR